MTSKPRSRPRRRYQASSYNHSHASISKWSMGMTDLYYGLQKELDTIQRLKLLCIAGNMQSLHRLFPEFVAAYEMVHHSLRRHLDDLSPNEARGPAAVLTKLEIYRVCEDGAAFINAWLFPLANSPDDRVFLLKSAADFRRYICLAYGTDDIQTSLNSHTAFGNYLTAFRIASELLNPANPNRLSLTLNFALFYRQVLGWDLHACHLAKIGFDDAVKFIETFREYDVSEDSIMFLNILMECMISWTSYS